MRNHVTHLCAALAIAACGTACTGRTQRVVDRHDQTGGMRGVNQRVVLRGCVQPAVEGQGYALRHVVMLPPEQQPMGQDTIDNPVVTPGSWVRLAGSADVIADVKSHLNNEVAITGDIVDTGATTIGTAGHDGSAPAQTPPKASVANGDAPSVAVEKIEKIAENCVGG